MYVVDCLVGGLLEKMRTFGSPGLGSQQHGRVLQNLMAVVDIDVLQMATSDILQIYCFYEELDVVAEV